MKEINLIISQEQFKQNQRNGILLREIRKNKQKEQDKINVCKFIVAICMVGLAIMVFGMIGV